MTVKFTFNSQRLPKNLYYLETNLSCGILINNRSMKTLCAVYNDDTTLGSFPYFSNQVIAVIWSIASPISLQDHTHHGALEKCMHLLNEQNERLKNIYGLLFILQPDLPDSPVLQPRGRKGSGHGGQSCKRLTVNDLINALGIYFILGFQAGT